MSHLRILVADDNQFMRTAYKRILDTQDEFEVVAMAADGEDALGKAIALAPDVAILDIRMPKMDGIEAAHRITERHPLTGIVLISAYDDLAFVSAIMKDGAQRKAYILKNSLDDIAELIRVVEAVANGLAVLDPAIVEKLMTVYLRQSPSQPLAFTDMEEEVLRLMLAGYDDLYITRHLGLKQEPMEAIADSACAKLGVTEFNGDRNSHAVQSLINHCVK